MTNFIKDNQKDIFSATFNLSNQAIYLMNSDGNIIFANETALENLGYTLDEIEKLYVWDVDAIVDSEEKYLETVKNFELVGPLGRPNIIESFHKRKNGEKFPVEIVSKFVTISDQQFLISYVKDITSRIKRTEDINFYFELINSSNDMIFLVELDTGVIEFVNETVCNNLGYSLSEIKKMKVSDFRKPFIELDNIEIPEVFKKINEVNDMTTFGIYITKDGKKIPVETNVHKKDYLGKKFIVAISRNITERLSIEREKEDLNNKLTNYNATLHKEIANAKKELIDYENIMKRQSKMAAMGEMLENIAHQWRQPLSAISVLSTGMILQNEEKLLTQDSLSSGLSEINEQAQYLSKTIDDFRNFFKPNKQKNYFNLEDLFRSSIKLSRAKYSDNNIDFIIKSEELELYTYENEFLQVILNLIGNAEDELKNKDFKKCIIIESYKENDYVLINVKDNGGGISPDIMGRIFEPYFTTKHNYQGTGIGLYMSQNIIKHMNGSIEVSNCDITYEGDHYTGACFEIKIPL